MSPAQQTGFDAGFALGSFIHNHIILIAIVIVAVVAFRVIKRRSV